MTAPWRGVFPGTWQPSDAAFSTTPPGAMVSEAMLGPVETAGVLACPTPSGLTLTGTASTLAIGLACPATSTLTVTGLAPTLTVSRILDCPTPATLTIAGTVPTLGVGLGCPAPSGLVVGGLVPSLNTALECPAPSTLTLDGFAPTLDGAEPVPEETNRLAGGMFVQALYARRKRTKAPPRFIDRYDAITTGDESPANGDNLPTNGNNSTGKNLLPVQNQPKIVKVTPVKTRRKLPTVNLFTIAHQGGVAQANAERLVKAELEIQARRNLNDAIAVLLLLAS